MSHYLIKTCSCGTVFRGRLDKCERCRKYWQRKRQKEKQYKMYKSPYKEVGISIQKLLRTKIVTNGGE